MSAALPRVYTIAAGTPFLEVLAGAIQSGLPFPWTKRPPQEWSILLPTRRATRRLSEILRERSETSAILLPRIRPIGDVDEDSTSEISTDNYLPPAQSDFATLLELSGLAMEWAQQNADLPLAASILASPALAHELARSLVELVTTFEIQEVEPSGLKGLYDLDIAEHRQSILGLINLVQTELPVRRAREGVLGAATRRGQLLKHEASRLSTLATGPVIAAGSTGTIPATRVLLNAIANHPLGAVVLPGLDLLANEESWSNLPPEHPQFAMKQFLQELGLRRADVLQLGPPQGARGRLLSEIMRPSATASHWHECLPPIKDELAVGLQGLSVLEAPDQRLEARMIALILRETLEHPGKTAALVTPSRSLAERVSAELARWEVSVFDSAGISFASKGTGLAMALLLNAVLSGFHPVSTFAFLGREKVTMGLEPREFLRRMRLFEIVALRRGIFPDLSYGALLQLARDNITVADHNHPLLRDIAEADWLALCELANQIDGMIAALLVHESDTFAMHVERLQAALSTAFGAEIASAQQFMELADALNEAKAESWRRQKMDLSEAALILNAFLRDRRATIGNAAHPRLEILGTLEARLLAHDVLILGGLNETIWPDQPDPGPWLSRTMRETLGLPQPERNIGLAAHSFEQGAAAPNVYLTYSRRLGQSPEQPSRWLLRLNAVLQTAGLPVPVLTAQSSHWLDLARALDMPDQSVVIKEPVKRPAFGPPVESRPTNFSVTEIETLIRDPYAIYVRKVLELVPLPQFAEKADARLRGSLVHLAIGEWNKQGAPGLEALLASGANAFAAIGDIPQKRFWWPHFLAIATFLAGKEIELAGAVAKIHAEISGRIKFDIDGTAYSLRGRADRIDILAGGEARIIDYKTGKPPSADQVKSGLAPQLTLEAAVLLNGGFKALTPLSMAQLLYIHLPRRSADMKLRSAIPDDVVDIDNLAHHHLASLKSLLAHYQSVSLPYLPRLRMAKERDASEFDHLSRYLEWRMAGRQ